MACPKPLKNLIYVLLPPAFWLGVWQVCAFLVDRRLEGRGNELQLPYPASVWTAFTAMVGMGEFWATVAASLGRIALGLAWGVVLGAVLAVLTCASPGPTGSSPPQSGWCGPPRWPLLSCWWCCGRGGTTSRR